MKASIIRIGNSQGVRIPKVFLEQAQLAGEVELVVRDRQIIISPTAGPRQNWAIKFRVMAGQSDDRLLDVAHLHSPPGTRMNGSGNQAL